MNRMLKKLIALFLVILLTSANLLVLGEYTISHALSDEELIEQTTTTNNRNIEFNSYLEGGSHNYTYDIGSEEAKIYINVKVMNAGYLENGTIEFQNTNFKLKDGISNENIQSIDRDNNIIVLNKLNSGSDIVLELPIEILRNDNIGTDYFNKEVSTKFTASYIDGNGNEKAIEKEMVNKISWKATPEADLTPETTKYIPYTVNDSFGVMVQTKVNTKVKDNILPIKNTNIEVIAPIINNIKPTTVTVMALKTEATNGKTDGYDFNTQNYTYDVEAGTVSINTSNLSDGTISWKENAVDEYIITYLYEGEEIYNYVNENGINATEAVTLNLDVYNNEETVIQATNELKIESKEVIGQVGNFEISSSEDISKGYIYANYVAEEKLETEYTTKYIATIESAKLITSLEFVQNDDKFITADESEGSTIVGENNYAYNKKVEIRQDIFNKILGEDGVITLKDENGNELGKIDKNSTLENGIYSIDISASDNNKLVITTTAPITEGQLEINITKAIKGNIDYSKEQMQAFEALKEEVTGNTGMSQITVETETQLKEPELKAELSIDKTDWSTAAKNENVEIKAVLDTSSVYNALYQNPVIQIEFPEVVDRVDAKNIKLLYTDELEIGNAEFQTIDGKLVLNIMLSGTQTKYSIGQAIKGINIVINADITLKEDIATQETEVKMYYKNDTGISTYSVDGSEDTKEATVKVNAIAQNGIITENGINNIKENTNISSKEDGKVESYINTYTSARTATVYGRVTNSYSNPIGNIVILGRVPAEGNKKIDTDEDLGSNLNLQMQSSISLSSDETNKYTIYYSENIKATTDIDDTSNGWTLAPSNLANVKSYLIVTADDYQLAAGEQIYFSYGVQIPENLEHDKSAYQMYKVYYNNITEVGSLAETKESAIVGVTTGKAPELEVVLSSNFAQNSEVRAGQIVKFFATITNTGEVDATGVRLNIDAPDGTAHVEYENNGYSYSESVDVNKKIAVGNIPAGQSVEVDFDLLMKLTNNSNSQNVVLNVGVTSSEAPTQKNSNDYTLTVTKGDFYIYISSSKADGSTLKSGNEVEIRANIGGVATVQNAVITAEVPEGVSFETAYIIVNGVQTTDNITIDNNKLQVTLSELPSGNGSVELNYTIKINDYTGALRNILHATGDNVSDQYSNEIIYNVGTVKLEITQTSQTPQYILEGENITYNFVVRNTGDVSASMVTIEDLIPDGLTFVSASYEYNNTTRTISSNNDSALNIYLYSFGAGATCNITLTLKAKTLYVDEVKEVTNYATVKSYGIDDIESNRITNYIEYDPDQHILPGGGTTTRNYGISGVAWLDSDQNGRRDDGESIISGVQVILLQKSNNNVINTTTTNNNGEYSFTNLSRGEYLVVFIYDSGTYSITQYQATDVNTSLNSDAISTTVTLNGEERLAGVTDTITISNRTMRNIDIGLYTSEKFDLRIDKYVTKITLTTPTIGTREYTYNNLHTAKVEILERNFGQSSAVIEYKIAIKNEGSVAGYARKIVDYLPDNAEFNSELNADWYLSDDGNLYNATLANTIINPGETKEITLLLTKRINEVEIINNSAEIYESYNEQGLKDIDSTEANKRETEDDISDADVVLSPVTGTIIKYTAIIVAVIAILVFGAYEIKKRVLNKKDRKEENK